jgi:hypothetical protein
MITVTLAQNVSTSARIGTIRVTASGAIGSPKAVTVTQSAAPLQQPTVTTTAVSSVTTTSAVSGGNVTSSGGATLIARGVCWSTLPNPTTANSKTTDGSGIGTFTSNITGLTPNTTYHVRAYATNAAGTEYGNDLSFTTLLKMSAKDFNGDNKEDLLWRNYSTGQNAVWYMGTSGSGAAGMGLEGFRVNGIKQVLEPVRIFRDPAEAGGPVQKNVKIRNFDPREAFDLLSKPGNWDIIKSQVAGETKPGQIFSSPMIGPITQGLAPSGYAYLDTVTDMNWKIVGTGDFNGDGKTDLLWRNDSNGLNAVWYMNGVTVTGYAYLDTVTDMNWKIVGTADFNGDGKVDIIWRNYATGQNGVWYLNGVTYIGYDYFMTASDLNWHIVNH